MKKGFYLKMRVKGPLQSCGGGVGLPRLNMPVLSKCYKIDFKCYEATVSADLMHT